jgi:hypothetical protein
LLELPLYLTLARALLGEQGSRNKEAKLLS